jgi:quercetin dioxygenase-like cupin family protein
MRLRKVVLVLGVTALSVTAGSAQPPPARTHRMINAAELTYTAAPNYLPRGAEIARIAGDAGKPGLFIARIKFPANYRIGPHFHTADEYITVLNGSVTMGMGKSEDDRSAKTIEAGGEIMMPAREAHWLRTSANAVVIRTAVGPFRTTYLNPADDPARIR